MKKLLFATALTLTSLCSWAQSELYPQHFDLEEVNLLDGPLKRAQDLNIKFLMSYDVDRLLSPFLHDSRYAIYFLSLSRADYRMMQENSTGGYLDNKPVRSLN